MRILSLVVPFIQVTLWMPTILGMGYVWTYHLTDWWGVPAMTILGVLTLLSLKELV